MPHLMHCARQFAALACLVALPFSPTAAQGRIDGGTPGAIVVEPSTPHSLGVRWPVIGDMNLNATIAVAYRAVGSETWIVGYPLFRTFNDRVSPDNVVKDGHLFAGSIVDLTPDTEYEVRLSLNDPDGGSTVRTQKMRTAPIPHIPEGLRRRHVAPLGHGQSAGGNGTQSNPFLGLSTALQHAQPGDLLVLAPGLYGDGPFVPPSGTREKPIVIQGPIDGSAVLDGRGGGVLVNVSGREHVWLDRLTFRGARELVSAHNAHHIVVTRNHFDVANYGFTSRGAIYREATGFYISDNTFRGTTHWPRSRGIESVLALNITGSGHVVSYNLVQNMGDGVHNGDDGRLSASDIHNNDIETCTDDGIETDYSDTNVRVYRNRITNVFSGISAQPAHGGPVYIFRNLILNAQYSPFKLHNDTAGVLVFHNTSVKSGIPFYISINGETVRDVITRNNLFVGTGSPALSSTGRMSRIDFDNDGYEWAPRGAFALWNGKDYGSTSAARGSGEIYSKRGAFTMGPYRTFATLAAPQTHERQLDRVSNDPRLDPSSRAIDHGSRMPNFNDRFTGTAPDLGCCELGDLLPQFGPRPDEIRR